MISPSSANNCGGAQMLAKLSLVSLKNLVESSDSLHVWFYGSCEYFDMYKSIWGFTANAYEAACFHGMFNKLCSQVVSLAVGRVQ